IFADRPLNWPDATFGSQKMSEHTHISEERLCGLAIDPTQEVQDDEDQHLADCEQCMRRFVQFLKETESCCRELLCRIMQAALRLTNPSLSLSLRGLVFPKTLRDVCL